ncbi:MAG: tetratricopeptide repeat protein [Kiloniellales bacterium]
MKSLEAAILTIVIALACAILPPAAADQNDARLFGLFNQLQGATGRAEATATEAAIWHIWIEHDDRAVHLLMQKGIAAMNRGDRRGAFRDFDQIVQIAPDFAEGWNKRATVRYLLGQYEESLDDIERTLALEPRHFGALSGRGLVYVALDDLPQALQSFEAALAVNPHMPGVRSNAEAIRKVLKDREI